ncbi:glycosyltransferase, partial [Candidatus Parcubacteria bacterium]
MGTVSFRPAKLLSAVVVTEGQERICISVIIATYNAVATLSRCLESVISQSYSRIEPIVIDG